MSVPTDAIKEMTDGDVAAHNGVHCPFCSEECYPRGGTCEDVCAQDLDGAGLGEETLPRQELEESRLAGAVGAYEQSSRAFWKVEVYALEGWAFGFRRVEECEVGYLDSVQVLLGVLIRIRVGRHV